MPKIMESTLLPILSEVCFAVFLSISVLQTGMPFLSGEDICLLFFYILFSIIYQYLKSIWLIPISRTNNIVTASKENFLILLSSCMCPISMVVMTINSSAYLLISGENPDLWEVANQNLFFLLLILLCVPICATSIDRNYSW